MLLSRPSWVRRLVHGPCQGVYDALYDQYERLEDRYDRLESDYERADAAQAESAEAYHEAEVALSTARDEIERLEAELARVRAHADQVEASRVGLIRALEGSLTAADDAPERLEAVREESLEALLNNLFEVTALRQGVDHMVACPQAQTEAGEHLVAAAHRVRERADERAAQLREAVT